ncbi:hypothetical protein D3C75_870870 [compost metagenome]
MQLLCSIIGGGTAINLVGDHLHALVKLLNKRKSHVNPSPSSIFVRKRIDESCCITTKPVKHQSRHFSGNVTVISDDE